MRSFLCMPLLLGLLFGLGAGPSAQRTLGQAAAIEAVLEMPRSAPQHYVDGALALVDLERSDLAESIAQEFAALELDDSARVALVEKVGTARLSRLGRVLPAAADQVAACLAAANAHNNDPARLDQLTDHIVRGESTDRIAALQAIRRTGRVGVDHCLQAIRTADDPRAEARLREALVALEPTSVPALMHATSDTTLAVRTQSAYALGRLGELKRLASPLAAALLARPALLEPSDSPFGGAARWSYRQLSGEPITPDKARQQIDRAIKELLAGSFPFATDAEDRLYWAGKLRTPREAALQIAARLAEDRLAIDPADERLRLRTALLALESGVPTSEPMAELENLTLDEVSRCLDRALQQNYPVAAVACCDELAERRDPAALYAAGGQSAPLARALKASGSAVPYAALRAVMQINPQGPFPGSSEVAKRLFYFASATGEQRVVVAMPQLGRASELASLLLSQGYLAQPVYRGQEAVAAAGSTPDTEAVWVDLEILEPNVRETLFRLRRTRLTGALPIALLAADGRLLDAQTLADEHGGAAAGLIASPRIHSDEAAKRLAERLARVAPAGAPSAEERVERATACRGWIARLLNEGPTFYRTRTHHRVISDLTLMLPTAEAAPLLTGLGTPASQLELLGRARRGASPIEARKQAVEAFKQSVARHGLLLTADQVVEQYDHYNASVSADEATQQVLGAVLDVIESGRR